MGLKVTELNWLDLRLFIVQYSGQPEDGSAALSFNSNGTSLLIKSSVDATALILCTCGYERRVNTHTLLPRDPNIYAVRNKKYLNDKVISTNTMAFEMVSRIGYYIFNSLNANL